MKRISLLGVVVLMLFVASCAVNETDINDVSTLETISSHDGTEATLSEYVAQPKTSDNITTSTLPVSESLDVNNDAALKSPTKTYDVAVVKKWHSTSRLLETSWRKLLSDVDSEMPIEILRKVDNNICYVPYKIETGGVLYIFFHKEDDEPLEMAVFRNAVYSERKLSEKDFEDISVGTSIDAVIAVDPATKYVSDEFMLSDHFLSDGIIRIVYEKNDGKLFVVSKNYYGNDSNDSFALYSKVLEEDRVS